MPPPPRPLPPPLRPLPPPPGQLQPPLSDHNHNHRHQSILSHHRRTGPLTWLAAIACAVLSTAVIVVGLVVVVIYVVYQPKIPSVRVASCRLLRLEYDPGLGILGTKMVVDLLAENRNVRSHATLSGLGFSLKFGRTGIADLRAAPFVVPKRGTFPIHYVVESWPIPLDESANGEMAAAIGRNRIGFELEGRARTHWRVGVLLHVKQWTHLNCQLVFFPSNGSSIGVDCNSKSPH